MKRSQGLLFPPISDFVFKYIHPGRLKMEPKKYKKKNGGLEDDFPFRFGDF